MVDRAGLPRLTSGHVVEDILHGPAVGEGALPLLAAGLLSVPPGALVGMEEQHQLLLDQLPLLRVRRVRGAGLHGPRTPGDASRGHHGAGGHLGEAVWDHLLRNSRARVRSRSRHNGTVLVLLDPPGDWTISGGALLLLLDNAGVGSLLLLLI